MLDPRFLLFELFFLILFLLCLWHAGTRQERVLSRCWYLAELASALLFGLMLEAINVSHFSIYHYGHFFLSFKQVPICIGLMWAVLLYSSMYLSDCLRLPMVFKIALDVLLVLNIDLMMDPIAIRLGMWHWHVFSMQDYWTGDWFGVPYGNFYGWIMVALSFSLSARLFRMISRSFKKRVVFILPLLSFLPSEILLFSALSLRLLYWRSIVFMILFSLSACVAFLLCRSNRVISKADGMMVMIPISVQLFFVMCLLTPLLNYQVDIMLVSCMMLLLRSGYHLLTLKESSRGYNHT